MISPLTFTRPRRAAILATILLLIGATITSAHDMFVQPERFFVEENREVLVRVLNGTFSKSENSIARVRVRDISVVSPAGRAQVDTSDWSVAGDTSTFRVRTGAPGTYILAASTRPSVIALAAHDFNQYSTCCTAAGRLTGRASRHGACDPTARAWLGSPCAVAERGT